MQQQLPWWIGRVVLPGFFTILGVALGFAVGHLKDSLDAREAKKTFLKAIRVELSSIRQHLSGTLRDATQTKQAIQQGTKSVLHLLMKFQTGIYDTQIGKLKNVFDPLVIEVVEFYDSLSNLERVKDRLTSVSFDLTTLSEVQDQHTMLSLVYAYGSTLDEVIKRINNLIPKAEKLIQQLPQ